MPTLLPDDVAKTMHHSSRKLNSFPVKHDDEQKRPAACLHASAVPVSSLSAGSQDACQLLKPGWDADNRESKGVKDKNDIFTKVDALAAKLFRISKRISGNLDASGEAFLSFRNKGPCQLYSIIWMMLEQSATGEPCDKVYLEIGIDMAQDAAKLLKECEKVESRLEPNLINLCYLLNHLSDLQILYKWYRKQPPCMEGKVYFELEKNVFSCAFHIFRNIQADRSCTDAEKELFRCQRKWSTTALRNAIKHFIKAEMAKYADNAKRKNEQSLQLLFEDL